MSTSFVCLVEKRFTIMMIFLGRTAATLSLIGLFLFSVQSWAIAGEADEPGATPPVVSSIEQALSQVTSEDESVRDAAIRTLVDQGDAGLLPRLEQIRANADRSTRQAIKPLMDSLKNRANLTSPSTDVRRSAATDLGSAGRVWAIPWLEAAAANEPNKWVRYTMEESAALLRLASDDTSIKTAAAEKLGELRSGNAVPALKALVEACLL